MDDASERIEDLIRQGRTIEAIKLLRETTGIGLREAKDEVERLRRELPTEGPPGRAVRPPSTGAVSQEVMDLARSGNKIGAIKVLREQTGLGLKEAKDRVEEIPGVSRSTGCLGSAALLGLAASLLATLMVLASLTA